MPENHRPQNPFTPLEYRLSSQLQGHPMNTSHFDSQAHHMSLHTHYPQTDPRYVVPPDYVISNVSPGHPQDYYQSQGPRPIFQPREPNFRTEPAQEPLPFEGPPSNQFASNSYEDEVYFDERDNDFLDGDGGTGSVIEDFQYTNDCPQNSLKTPRERSGQSSRNHPRESRDFEHDDPRYCVMSSEEGPPWSYQDTSRTRLETAIGLGRERRFQGEMERVPQEQFTGARGSRLSEWASSVTRPMVPRRRGAGSSRSTSPDEAIDNYQREPVA
ncbi:hypothetical protein CSIM01_04670 [Colletotrichum simmondsii]|uniref:Uncharacterized protein n=1 Tax=Colletotrichum simmondsii TaxID=703756 RepID=A0A135SH02_9PEZI|nr:hypothetical protein CSIM01_04670 [Colletotrichum simmondsii]